MSRFYTINGKDYPSVAIRNNKGQFFKGCKNPYNKKIPIPRYFLTKKYLNEKLSIREIGNILNTTAQTIFRRMREFGIRFRSHNESVRLAYKKHPNLTRRMERGTNWRGGRSKTWEGYIQIYKPGYKSSRQNGYILEHRYIMSTHLGRFLTKNEIVHHKNKNRTDNRVANLSIVMVGHNYSEVCCPKCNFKFKVK